jgi:hypothetical protein
MPRMAESSCSRLPAQNFRSRLVARTVSASLRASSILPRARLAAARNAGRSGLADVSLVHAEEEPWDEPDAQGDADTGNTKDDSSSHRLVPHKGLGSLRFCFRPSYRFPSTLKQAGARGIVEYPLNKIID